jgi:heptosyltransferase-3
MTVYQAPQIQAKRILVITMRYLGDTLLITPLLSALKQAYPDAEIDVLLPVANLNMLEGNKDVNRLIPVQSKPSILSFAKLLCSLYRQYDLSISTQGGDRPIICALIAGKFSMGFVSASAKKQLWKRLFLDRAVEFTEQQAHMVMENLRFCEALNIQPVYRVTPPRSTQSTRKIQNLGKYVVLHPIPQWRYKQWHQVGWVKVANFLHEKGYQIVLTGSPDLHEQQLIKKMLQNMPPATQNLAGSLKLSELTELIESAAVFIGPDTGITHLAAATGVPTIALYGPTDPKKWAPWPKEYASNELPFQSIGSQQKHNVSLIQGESIQGCVPCQLEGCEKNRQSHSSCLDELSAESVIDILNQWLQT